jgi:predicted nucleic-acid-binding Zn-ribbon protein
LAQLLQTNYSSYAYFAFTALGCDVEEGTAENGTNYQYPVGPVLPKRVEEPLLWLFYKFGYIGKNAALPGEIYCPECTSDNNYELPEDERTIRVKKGLFGKREVYVNRCCKNCGYKWEYIPE